MYKNFLAAIKNKLAVSQIIEDELLRYAYSTDASVYRMLPQLVLIVKNEAEVTYIIKMANAYDVKITFRAAGTSLSGQAVTDQVLVMLAADSWQFHHVFDNGNQVMLEPGIIGADANKYLKIYHKQIGPDPGSIKSAKIGGIIANNSSGMCCGTTKNSYATLKSMRAILADGTILDTSQYDSLNKFRTEKKDLLQSITAIRQKVMLDDELTKFIRKKFSIKNTSGYSLNAFLDFEDPIKILERLMIGSEGTLGFVSQVTLRTVPNHSYKALNLIYGKLEDLIKLTIHIVDFDVSSVELLDYFSLESVAGDKDLKEYLIELPDESYAAIMIEVTAENSMQLQDKITQLNSVLAKLNIYHQLGFTRDEDVMATIWRARSGVLPTIAGQRQLGSSVLIEDVAVEIQFLPELINDVRLLFNKFGFDKAAIFGHVLSGNIHFVITPNFDNLDELESYDKFMHEFTNLVAKKFNGSLKAEHGSGRNISPFAIVEWGDKCWNIMWEIKDLLDRKGILNPDVKLTRDNTLHMQHLKSFTPIHDGINKCMECGFCEPVCPSRTLSLTPRQRNAVARKISTLIGNEKLAWQEKYNYYGIQTCATTGMCKTACPVGINTGAFILEQKPKDNQLVNHAKEIKLAKTKVQLGNFAASIVGSQNLQSITKALHGKFKSIPIYLDSMPKAQSCKFDENDTPKQNEILLVPACPNRVFGADNNFADYPSKLLLEKMSYTVKYLSAAHSSCCGQMYHSQCNQTMQENMTSNLSDKLKNTATAIIDNSSCSGFAKDSGINLLDINKFVIDNIDRLQITKKYRKIALHIDCSTAKHSFNPKYLKVLQMCADEVIMPEGIKCCGFAGDKGFTVPELNASSLAALARQIEGCEIGITFNRSCQIGLTHHGKIQYISFVGLMLNCISN